MERHGFSLLRRSSLGYKGQAAMASYRLCAGASAASAKAGENVKDEILMNGWKGTKGNESGGKMGG